MININRFINNLKCISMVIVLVLFTSCELVLNSFDKPVKEFFLENTSTASINHHVINRETFINPITNAETVSSETDVTIIFYMKNPQSFIFTDGSNIFLRNYRLDPLPTLEQNLTDKSVLYLKLQKDLLRTFETESVKEKENKTLDFLIELKHPISNVDFQSYSFSIDCNSIPPTIFSPVYYKNATNYVIAFNMPKKSDVKSIHNDLEKLIINGKKYDISIAEDGTITFPQNKEIKSGDVKEVNGIEEINAEFITLEDYQPFYFDTEVGLNQIDTSATLSLMDTANFTSTVSISSNSNTLGSVNLKINEKPVDTNDDPIVINQDNDNNAKFTIIAPSHSIDSKGVKEPVSGVSVKYTLTNTNTNEVVTGSNNGSGSVTIDVPIGTYKLECISHKDYCADSITTFENIQIKGSLFNFYVASGANDSNADGSISKPFRTIQAAVEKIKERNNDSQSSVYAPYKLILLTDICESNINIAPDSNLYLTIKSFENNYTIDAQEKNKVMTIKNKAFVTLENVTLTNGSSTYGTGGVEVYGSLTLSDNCIISNNTVTSHSYGAGIYLRPNAELTMNGGKITENTSDDYSSFGGGVYLEDDAEFVMNDGEISNNSAKYGGGVCVSGGTFEMNGGSISNNTANKGSGVYVANHTKANGVQFLGKFYISGGACIKGGDDVYLGSQNVITITGDTGELSSYPVATITPENYAEKYEENYKEVQVLAAGEGITLKEQVGKFNVTKYNNNVDTKITETGFLKNTLTLGENPELTEDLYNICSTINVNSAKGMNKLSQLAGKDFAGKTINLKAHVKLDTEYEPIHTFSGVFDGGGGRCSIEIEAPENYAWDSTKGKALFYIVQGENAEIKNLTVKGTAEGAGIAYTLTNKAKISNCKSYVNITTKGDNYPTPGGIVSNLNNGSRIENCENYGTIICDRENTGGGIVGDMASSDENDCHEYPVIANCTNYGDVIINDVTYVVKMGGICGDFSFGTIFNCANKGKVTVTATETTYSVILGGIVGFCWGRKIDGIINCYNIGEIHSNISNSTKQNIGGIVGSKDDYSGAEQVPKFVNTVNNYDQIFSFGNLAQFDTENTTNNFYKKSDGSPISSYEESFDNSITRVIDTLNTYSRENGYLEWKEDDEGNIIFSKDIIDN